MVPGARAAHRFASMAARLPLYELSQQHTLSSTALFERQSSRARVAGALETETQSNLLKMGLFFILSLGEGVHTRWRRGTRQRGGPTSEFTAAGPAREARSQKLSCGQNERKRSSDRTPSDLARDECSSRRVSFGVRSCLSARRRSDCRRRFDLALVGGFAAADLGFWFSFRRRAGLLL